MRLRPPVPACPAVLIAALGAPAALAQAAPAQDPAATMVEEVTVNVVNIDVHVTDRRGRPISDLSVDDFEVLEEGEPVEVTNFFSAAGRTNPEPAVEELEWSEANGPRLRSTPDPHLSVALYIDRNRTSQASLIRIEPDLAVFLTGHAKQERDIRFLLVTGDPELNVRVPFTTDPQELLHALEELRSEPTSRATDDSHLRRRALTEIAGAYTSCAQQRDRGFGQRCEPCLEPWANYLGSADSYAAEMESRAAASIAAVGEFVTALGGLTGPKALIYVSDGLPQRPGAEIYDYLGELCPDRQTETSALALGRDGTTWFNRLSAFSNANRVTFYPIDAAGIRASSSTSVTLDGVLNTGDGRGTGGYRLQNALSPSNENDRLLIDNLQGPLSLLADETGGRAVFNEAHPAEALEEVAADFGSYYSLGYAALAHRRHPIRQIEVRLTRPRKGWQVRYRRSYVLKSDDQRLADRLFAALKLGEQTNPLAAEVTFGDPEAAPGAGQRTLPVEVRVPASAVTLLPGPSGPAGAVRIFLLAENEDGGRTPMRQKTLALSEAQLPPPGENAVVVVNVDLPPGTFEVAVGIRDEASGRGSYLVREAVVELAED